ncbi:MarR family transcriptional regulator [Planctomonas sp. JC2975]|uniref:MarR family winged helix-turn-helix transcriptional regulator n=1 Tax=Planctomonas sp. JC2975 TaxID=2729626 RepID=UPI0014729BE5|nr:MarR family transcriptional regulator [Planctomonas sp. JC2975]NNC12925.1 MarR family transcriptional regulator [Planctomonas sp. JC2975]
MVESHGAAPIRSERDEAVAHILHELIVVSRRGVISARVIEEHSAGPDLTEAEQSIMAYLAERPGIRSTDVATAFALNRSTVSRQLDRLVELGLVRTTDSPGRGRPLELTDLGRELFDSTIAKLRAETAERMSTWTNAQIAEFAAALARFNEPDTL